MRHIALNSQMTVGNLYRYFKNKDELANTIVSPTYAAIDIMIKDLTKGRVSFFSDSSDVDFDPEEFKELLSQLSDRLTDIYLSHKAEVNILMMGSRLNKELTEWFMHIVAGLISKHYGFSKDDPRIIILSKCYAKAIFEGMKIILRESEVPESSLKNMVKLYLSSYYLILQQDITSLIQA